ncbi:hypothetical protein AVEN_146452-1 [Araneus ventricosus]|uniref:Uncharacterized protein n=1 Tax=Araneus ventricosus TaxID=182803 RepID=A0A4Y2NUP0_ARAVE|nr:hypothetical protein AVEN_146452-1 [Araneus ventricosus]
MPPGLNLLSHCCGADDGGTFPNGRVNNPDSNFSLQQACHKFVMTRGQACSKLTKASKSPWNEPAASLPCKLIANYRKNRVRTQPGIELATYRLVARRRYHSASSTTRGKDRFR